MNDSDVASASTGTSGSNSTKELMKRYGMYYRKADYKHRGSLASKFKTVSAQAKKRKKLVINIPDDLIKKQKSSEVEDFAPLPTPVLKKNVSIPMVAEDFKSTVILKLEKSDSFPSEAENFEVATKLNNYSTAADRVSEASTSEHHATVANETSSQNLPMLDSRSDSDIPVDDNDKSPVGQFKPTANDVENNQYFDSKMSNEFQLESLQENTRIALEFLKEMRSNKPNASPKYKPFLPSLFKHKSTTTNRINCKHGLLPPPMAFQRFSSHTDALTSIDIISNNLAQWKHNLMLTTTK